MIIHDFKRTIIVNRVRVSIQEMDNNDHKRNCNKTLWSSTTVFLSVIKMKSLPCIKQAQAFQLKTKGIVQKNS